MKTPITPESLIELGFVEDTFNELYYKLPNVTICIFDCKNVYVDDKLQVIITNATTIEDIKDLIRLFK